MASPEPYPAPAASSEKDAAPQPPPNPRRETSSTAAPATAPEYVEEDDDKPKGLLAKLGVDPPVIIVLLKGSIPPTIAIAMGQSSVVSGYFLSFGYFIAIASFLALPVLPRGKFVVHVLISALCVCLGAAMGLLAMWSGLRARENTSENARLPGYNSSQNAVGAIWLIFNTWAINTVRARWPETFNLPSILYSILIDVTCTTGTNFTAIIQIETLTRELLVAILTGLGLATVTNLVLVPVSSRMIVAGQTKKILGVMKDAVRKQRVYLRSVDSVDVALVPTRASRAEGDAAPNANGLSKEAKAAESLAKNRDALLELLGAIRNETLYAKWDVAFGKLDGTDLEQILGMLRSIVIPIVGLNSMMNQFQRNSEGRHWIGDEDYDDDFEMKEAEQQTWAGIINRLRGAFDLVAEVVGDGLEHAGMVLELLPKPKAAKQQTAAEGVDVEAKGGEAQPGDAGFAEALLKKFAKFEELRGEIPKAWARERGFFTDDEQLPDGAPPENPPKATVPDLAQLYILLFLEKMMHASGAAVLDFVAFADEKQASGVMSKTRFIAPSVQMIVTAARNIAVRHDPDVKAFAKPKDPDHLPPVNMWQKFGNFMRAIPDFLGGEESALGLRAACATMSVGILAYLENTQRFFVEERIVWGLIMIAISLTVTSGQSIFGFALRIAGTVLGMVASYIAWYIVDQRTAGVIVFMWLFIFISFYFLFRFPRVVNASAVCVVTMLLIIGYELQVRKIGEAAAERTGQPVYPLYSLAPYRLATVAGGMLVAFLWTILPTSITTDRVWIRRETSAALYLLANYFSVVQETLRSKLRVTPASEEAGREAAVARLRIARETIFTKLAEMFPAIEDHLQFQVWEPSIGGRFPRKDYEELVARAKHIWEYLILMVYVVDYSPGLSIAEKENAVEKTWLHTLNDLVHETSPTAHMIVGALTLLSNAVATGQSLPPFLPLPKPFELTRQLLPKTSPLSPDAEVLPTGSATPLTRTTTTTDSTTDLAAAAALAPGGVLDMRHVTQYGYAEFAVLQVCATHLRDELVGMVRLVSGIVGVVDFSLLLGNDPANAGMDVPERVAVVDVDAGWRERRRRKGKGKTD